MVKSSFSCPSPVQRDSGRDKGGPRGEVSIYWDGIDFRKEMEQSLYTFTQNLYLLSIKIYYTSLEESLQTHPK